MKPLLKDKLTDLYSTYTAESEDIKEDYDLRIVPIIIYFKSGSKWD